MNYEENCGVKFLDFRYFSTAFQQVLDTLFSTAPSKMLTGMREVVRFFASIKVFLQMGGGGVQFWPRSLTAKFHPGCCYLKHHVFSNLNILFLDLSEKL